MFHAIQFREIISVYCNNHTTHKHTHTHHKPHTHTQTHTHTHHTPYTHTTHTHTHALCGQKAERLCFSGGRNDTATAGFILSCSLYCLLYQQSKQLALRLAQNSLDIRRL